MLEKKTRRFSLSLLAAAGLLMLGAGCDVEQTEEGDVSLPEYEVEQTEEGNLDMPEYDVDTADVDVDPGNMPEYELVQTEEGEAPSVTVEEADAGAPGDDD
jgi:hypothetical protein